MPCFTTDKASIDKLHALIEAKPGTIVETNVATGVVKAGDLTIQASIPATLRDAFVTDQWNPTSMLLAEFAQVKGTASRLPYVAGF